MKRVLVIGGSYFAGRVFVELLSPLKRYQIYVFNRGHLSMGIPGVEQITGDREIPDQISANMPDHHWDAVIDFCAYTPMVIDTLIDNMPGTIGHYIFISTTSVYAPSKTVPVRENAPKVNAPQPELGIFKDYGYHKWLAERTLENHCHKKNIPFTILRPAIIYGRYNYAPRESFFFDHAISGRPLVVPDNQNVYYSFVWVEDMAEMIIACLENPSTRGQTYNLASVESFSYATMADVIEEVCGRKIKRRTLSMEAILDEQVPMPFPPDSHLLYDGGRMNRALGFEHTPFILGMASTWRDYKRVIRHRKAREQCTA